MIENENDVIAKAAGGDVKALSLIISEYENIYGIIMSKIFDKQIRRTALLEKTVFFYETAKKFDKSKGAKFSTFVYQQALWRRWRLRKKTWDSKIQPVDLEEAFYNPKAQNHEDFYRAFAALEPRTKYVFKRRFFDEKKGSFEQIGKEINLTTEGVRVVYKKGLKQLRKSKNLSYE